MATLELTVDDAEVRRFLQALQDKLGDLTPFFRDVGEALLNSTRQRFTTATAPDGTAWAALSPRYAATKSKNAHLILVLNGYLKGTLNYRAEKDALRIGSPMIYAADHQFGLPGRNLPARPFLGLSAADTQYLLDTLAEYLAKDP